MGVGDFTAVSICRKRISPSRSANIFFGGGWFAPSGVFCIQESGSGLHLIVLFQSGENRLKLKKVESRRDLDVGDHSFGDPGID
jgi:hypothetical protein